MNIVDSPNRLIQTDLVGLYDLMYKLDVAELVGVMASLESLRKAATTLDDGSQPYPSVGELGAKTLLGVLDRLRGMQESLELDHALRNQIYMFSESLRRDRADLSPNVIAALLGQICGGVYANLKTRYFLFVPSSKAEYFHDATLFGMAALVFPDATPEMVDMGNCFAAELHTACVFHAMRVSEHGLRALARKMKVSITDKGRKCPLEYGTWDKVITKIDAKIESIRRLPAGPKKSQTLSFYSDAASHCRHIRDIWRNDVSHTRKRYNEHEAHAAIARVVGFMSLLAERLYSDKERSELVADSLKILPAAITAAFALPGN